MWIVLQRGSSSSGFLIRKPPNKNPPWGGRSFRSNLTLWSVPVYEPGTHGARARASLRYVCSLPPRGIGSWNKRKRTKTWGTIFLLGPTSFFEILKTWAAAHAIWSPLRERINRTGIKPDRLDSKPDVSSNASTALRRCCASGPETKSDSVCEMSR